MALDRRRDPAAIDEGVPIDILAFTKHQYLIKLNRVPFAGIQLFHLQGITLETRYCFRLF